MSSQPLVSCIMPTYNRRQFVPHAIKYYLRQDYPNKELIIIDDGIDAIEDLMPADDRIRYIRLNKKLTVGAKRNLACEQARGEIIIHWDDDDWMHPNRINYEVENMRRANADVSGISKVLFYDLHSGKIWLYEYPKSQQTWLCGGSLCYLKDFWAKKTFTQLDIGEDTRFILSQPTGKILDLPDFKFYVAIVHPANTCPKSLSGSYWHRWQGENAQMLMNGDWDFYAGLSG